MNKNCIGLFGTCGNSTWRNKFMEIYDKKNIIYYNPQVDDWKPEDAVIEAERLANDQIILFPITVITIETTMVIRIRDCTKDLEYERPLCVI